MLVSHDHMTSYNEAYSRYSSVFKSKLHTYSIIAFFIASRLDDVTLLEFDVNIYIELEDIFAID